MSWYLVIKFIHVLVAIVAVGSSAGSSLWLRLAMRSPANMPFALRTAKFLDEFLTRPGLIVLLVTGLWMAATRWTLSLFWIRLALLMVVIVLVALYIAVGPLLGWLIRVAETDGIASKRWARSEARFEIIGGASGLIIIGIVWLMVTKPS